jgi:hypothetical protein
MARHNQPDLFGDSQNELFDADAAPVAYQPDPDRVRARLHRILSEARAAQTLPWDRSRASLYRTIVPQMTCPSQRKTRPDRKSSGLLPHR